MFLNNFYDKMPIFMQNLGVTYYGYKLLHREYGKAFNELLNDFNKQQWFTTQELIEYQAQKLQQIISHCYSNVPYYKKLMDDFGIKPSQIKTPTDLSIFPILTKDDIRHNFNALISTKANKQDLITGHTSGTTGSPLHFFYDKNICRIKNILDWRQKNLTGINRGDKMAFFLGRMVVPTKQKKPPFWRYNAALNHLFFSSFHLSQENIKYYIEKLFHFKPVAIEGYPSTMYLIAKFLLNEGKNFKAKAVFTSSETLLPIQRETIEAAFSCKLFDFYGLAERVAFATECEAHTAPHINSDFGIVEILDYNNNPVQPGNIGRIVATGLHNYSMPLIRYQTNDITSINPNLCSCGRGFPLMSNVTSKAEDIITTNDGRFISASILTHPFKPLKGIHESQIIQEDVNTIIVKIVRLSEYSETQEIQLINELQNRVGPSMVVKIEYVNQIERTNSGKLRWVISKVPLKIG